MDNDDDDDDIKPGHIEASSASVQLSVVDLQTLGPTISLPSNDYRNEYDDNMMINNDCNDADDATCRNMESQCQRGEGGEGR